MSCLSHAYNLPMLPGAGVSQVAQRGRSATLDDMFSWKTAFTNPLFRIKINNIQLKETQEENAKTNAEVRACLPVVKDKLCMPPAQLVANAKARQWPGFVVMELAVVLCLAAAVVQCGGRLGHPVDAVHVPVGNIVVAVLQVSAKAACHHAAIDAGDENAENPGTQAVGAGSHVRSCVFS